MHYLRKCVTTIVVIAAAVLSVFVSSPSASAASRDGICDGGEFCYYFNSDQQGSVSDFIGSLDSYGSTQPDCYEFRGVGNGQGVCVKNNAASVWNRSARTVRVFFNSSFAGTFQDFAAGARSNLRSDLKNNNASHRFAPTSPDPCATVGHGDQPGPAGPTVGASSEKVERVIAAARSQVGRGLVYSWGAGGRSGATCGISSPSDSGVVDYDVYGFDCSGLMQYAFWAGAGVNIGGDSRSQSMRGTLIPFSQARAGDLIFWGSRGATTHVALMVGNGQIIESSVPRNSSSVHARSVYGSHTYAVRIL